MTPLRRTSSGRRGSAICDAVVDVDRRLVDVGADLERAGDRQRSVGRRARAEIDQVLDAGELLLDRRGDGLARAFPRWRPGSVAVIVTVGGAISGYCATGSTCEATRPASVMMIAMTPGEDRPVDEELRQHRDALETGAWPVSADGSAGRAGCAAAALASGAATLALACDVTVTGAPGRILSRLSMMTRSPAFSPESIVQSDPTHVAGLHGPQRRLAFRVDDEHEIAFLGLHHGRLRNEEHVVALARGDAHAHELSRQELLFRIVELGAQLLRAQAACRSRLRRN